MISIYIHIPFCKNICSYCDFSKMYYDSKIVKNYLNALEKEIKNNYNNEIVNTIYIGGGTPSILDIPELNRLFEIIKIFNFSKNLEFTVECNPEDITEEKVKIFKKNNVNRISIGVQSFNPKILTILNRKHDKNTVFKAVELLKKNNIDNINIDLIYGINGQSIKDIKNDLEDFLKLNIPHISYYSLILEKNTKLYINKYQEISDDLCAEMYEYISQVLTQKGYIHYEISNFSIDGYESRHNLVYWNNEEYYGFGLGAHGYINNIRYENTRSISKYISGKFKLNEEKIDLKTNLENEIILGFRKMKGINKNKFKNKYSKDITEIFKLDKLIKDGFLINDTDNIYINPKYMFISNEILIKILDSM